MAKYCFINLIQFDEDVCDENGNNGYKHAMNFIKSGSYDFIFLGKNEAQYVGYMSRAKEHELISTKFIPFIFIHYPEECKFVDAVTGAEFSYTVTDKERHVREFLQDKGGFGQLIKDVQAVGVEDTISTNMDSYIKTIDVEEYKNELDKLAQLTLEGYKNYYAWKRGVQRTKLIDGIIKDAKKNKA